MRKNDSKKNDVIQFIILFILFFLIINMLFFNNDEDFIEHYSSEKKWVISYNTWIVNKNSFQHIESLWKDNIKYTFNPIEIEKELQKTQKIKLLSDFIYSKINDDKNINIKSILNEEKRDIRWIYSRKTIELFDVNWLSENELLSVFIHEFWHYIDIRFLSKIIFLDTSNKFYDVSWNNTSILKKWMKINDFVSWYSTTNKYEDFAESFTYYILFNSDFENKSKLNNKLKQKYEFFWKYIFKNNEFKKTNFRTEKKVEIYYRDTTKIPYDIVKFIKYINFISPL